MHLLFILSIIYYYYYTLASANSPNFGNKGFIEDENRQHLLKEEQVSLNDNRNSANHFSDTLPGEPQLDYPAYNEIPQTSFSCKGKVNWHYYADPATGCQVFHVCEAPYSRISFLCPIGSIFNQRHLVCDWWYNFDCGDAKDLYTLTNGYNDQMLSEVQESGDRRGFDLSPASSGGNSDPSLEKDFAENASTLKSVEEYKLKIGKIKQKMHATRM